MQHMRRVLEQHGGDERQVEPEPERNSQGISPPPFDIGSTPALFAEQNEAWH
jgi:hypothetical protein